jgi:hypothetical protein
MGHGNLPLGKIYAEIYPSFHCSCLPSTKEVLNCSRQYYDVRKNLEQKVKESNLTMTLNKIVSNPNTLITECLVACYLLRMES